MQSNFLGALSSIISGFTSVSPRDPAVKPWLTEKRWSSGRVKANSGKQFFNMLVFAVFWNAVIGMMLFVALSEKKTPEPQVFIIFGVLALVGVCIAGYTVLVGIRWKKFGDMVLVLASNPATIGGELKGVIHLRAMTEKPAKGYMLTLTCANHVRVRRGKSTTTDVRVLWKDTKTEQGRTEPSSHGPKTNIPVDFAIVSDMPETDNRRSGNQIIWRLKLEADVTGVDLHAEFDVPVFKLS